MKAKWLPISAAVIMALGSASASAVDFHGYFRSGVAVSKDGGMQAKNVLGDNIVNKVGRLGLEDDTYSEIQLGQEVYNKGGKSFYVDSMFAMASDGSNDWEATNGDGTKVGRAGDGADFALRQFNVQAKGLFGGNEVTWAGKRYYQRHDVHIADFYYWNISGAGAGVEAIQAGPGQLSFAWVRNDRSGTSDGWTADSPMNVNTLDARYAGLPVWANATLEVGVDYALVNPTDAQKASSNTNYKNAKNGLMLTAELTQGLLGGFNKTVLQYGTEGYSKAFAFLGDGSWYGAEAKDGADGYRVINHGVISLGDSWDLSHMLSYGVGKQMWDGNDSWTAFAGVVRPVYKWNDIMKTEFEYGYGKDTNKATSGTKSSDNYQKFTVAQAFAAGKGFWARPEIRVFASYVKKGGDGTTNVFNGGTDNNTMNYGVQAEAWW